jgi:hypothetical protein
MELIYLFTHEMSNSGIKMRDDERSGMWYNVLLGKPEGKGLLGRCRD